MNILNKKKQIDQQSFQDLQLQKRLKGNYSENVTLENREMESPKQKNQSSRADNIINQSRNHINHSSIASIQIFKGHYEEKHSKHKHSRSVFNSYNFESSPRNLMCRYTNSQSPQNSQREILFTRKKKEEREDLMQKAQKMQQSMFKQFKNETFQQFQEEQARYELKISSVPLQCVDYDLQQKLRQKVKKYIVHTRDFSLNFKKDTFMNLPHLIKQIQKDQINSKLNKNQEKNKLTQQEYSDYEEMQMEDQKELNQNNNFQLPLIKAKQI